MQMFRLRSTLAVLAIALGALIVSAESASAHDGCCCPPPPIKTTLCVKPPCSCCAKTVSVCIPGCCTEPPQVCWKKGFLGRQVGIYTWPCCGHSVKVVVTRRGDVKVRG